MDCKYKSTKWSSVYLTLVILMTVFLGNVSSRDEKDEKDDDKRDFWVWVPFAKGFSSMTVELGEVLPIRCRVSVNGTEWTADDDLEYVSMTFYKDGVELPPYWSNRTLAVGDNVIVHSKVAFDYVEAEEHHRGMYECRGSYDGHEQDVQFFVRVKEEQPLWPAMILGVQVVVLCTIYFLYEQHLKRREGKLEDDE